MIRDDMSFFQKRVSEDEAGFGQDLRDLRLMRGMTEDDVSRLSGIHPIMVRILEEERFHDLQDAVYAERSVRVLARALDVRVDFLLLKYRKALELRGVVRTEHMALRPMARRRDFFVTSRVGILAGVLATALVLGGYVMWQVRQISAPPHLVIVSPTEGHTAHEPRVAVTGSTEPTAFVTVNGQQVVVQPNGEFAADLRIPSGLTTVRVEARRRYGDPSVVERRVLFERPETASLP